MKCWNNLLIKTLWQTPAPAVPSTVSGREGALNGSPLLVGEGAAAGDIPSPSWIEAASVDQRAIYPEVAGEVKIVALDNGVKVIPSGMASLPPQ